MLGEALEVKDGGTSRSVDRRLVGIMAIALIFSTILTLFLVGEKPKEWVMVTRNIFPAELKETEHNPDFLLSMVVRRPMASFVVEYSVLTRIEVSDPHWTEAVVQMASGLDGAVSWEGEIEWVNETDRRKLKLHLIDVTDVLASQLPANEVTGADTLFAVLTDPRTGEVQDLLAGVSDFFYEREEKMVEMSISHNENSTSFAGPDADREDASPISEAPLLGRIDFGSVERDDQLVVVHSLKGRSIPGHPGMMQIIRMVGDGKLREMITNCHGGWVPPHDTG